MSHEPRVVPLVDGVNGAVGRVSGRAGRRPPRRVPREGSVDLRRSLGADVAERIVHRADGVDPQDRELLRAVFGHGRSVAELARLLGPGVDVRRLRKRIRRLTARTLSPLFVFVWSRRDRWAADRRRVAVAYFLQGHSIRRVSRETGLTVHEVRQHRLAVEELFHGMQAEVSR
jgi:hypothetical protein